MGRRYGKAETRSAGELQEAGRPIIDRTPRQVVSPRQDKAGACGRGGEDSLAYMSAITDQLVSVIAEEAEHCERFLGLLRRQQELLIQGDTHRVEANVREQESALRRSRYLECRRRQLVSAVVKDCTLNAGAPYLAETIATVFNDYGSRLASLRASMQRSLARLHETKENNRTLIEQSLGNINEFIRSTNTGGAQRASH